MVTLGERVPRRRSPVAQWLARSLLRLLGWKLEIDVPDEPKLVILAAPHTSNWDAVLALSAILAIGIDIRWFGKHTIFRPPFAGAMRWLGGLPVNRAAGGGIVQQTTQAFAEKPQLLIGLAPEGTRSRVTKWKSGFHQMAYNAQVPILCAYLDYCRKVIGTGPMLRPSADYAADLETVQRFYRGVTPRHPLGFAANG